jgi:hypothetical protein
MCMSRLRDLVHEVDQLPVDSGSASPLPQVRRRPDCTWLGLLAGSWSIVIVVLRLLCSCKGRGRCSSHCRNSNPALSKPYSEPILRPCLPGAEAAELGTGCDEQEACARVLHCHML